MSRRDPLASAATIGLGPRGWHPAVERSADVGSHPSPIPAKIFTKMDPSLYTSATLCESGSHPVLNRVLDRLGPTSMNHTNERLFAALRALGCESRMTRDWFLAFTPTALRAISKVSNEFLAEMYEDPFAERSFVPAPLSRWRGAGDLGRFFRSRAPVIVLGVDYGRLRPAAGIPTSASYRDMHDELMHGRAWNADGPNLFTAARQ